MANNLIGRKVKFQDLHDDGTPDGEPTYGVIVSDDFASDFNNSYHTLDDLQQDIEDNGEGILGLVTADFGVRNPSDPKFQKSFIHSNSHEDEDAEEG